jgi:hypothetical protein
MGEDALQLSLAPDLAYDVARDPAEIGADRPERPVGALELLGVGIALMGDQRMFAHPRVGLAKLDAGLSGQLHQPLAGSMHQLGVGRKGDRLRLYGGVDDHLGKVGGLRRAGARRHRQALLDQRRKPLLPHPLAPAGQRRAVEGQLVPEELLAAEQLVIGVLNPARTKILVGEIVHVLEDREPRHQPRRQRRMAGLVRIDHAEPLFEEAPIDRPAELGERVIHVDDLVEPRPEEIILPAVSPLLGPHRITLRQADGETESRSNDPINLQEIKPTAAAFLQMQRLDDPRQRLKNQATPDSSRATL